MAFNQSWLYNYGWKVLSDDFHDISCITNNTIINVSRFYIYGRSKSDLFNTFISDYSSDLSDLIAFQHGILIMHMNTITPSFLDDSDRFQLHYIPDFNETILNKVIEAELPTIGPDMIFSAIEHEEYTNFTVHNMIGKTIKKVEILQLKAVDLWQEDYPRLGGLRLTLDDRSEVYLATQLRNIDDDSCLSILSPDQVNFDRIERIIEVQ